jgi:hypothetical protein
MTIIWHKVANFVAMNTPNSENKSVEGEDFYITPEGYKCFTEKYHLKRGYCCKSGCRHCPYGFDKKTGTIKK